MPRKHMTDGRPILRLHAGRQHCWSLQHSQRHPLIGARQVPMATSPTRLERADFPHDPRQSTINLVTPSMNTQILYRLPSHVRPTPLRLAHEPDLTAHTLPAMRSLPTVIEPTSDILLTP